MSATGLKQFDETLQVTHIWLKDLMDALRWTERGVAYKALRSVLHAIRDRLPVELNVHLSAQLPMLIRGLYYEGWAPGRQADPGRSREAFLSPVEKAFELYPAVEPDIVAAHVFAVLRRHISPGEMEKVLQALPKAIRELASAPAPH